MSAKRKILYSPDSIAKLKDGFLILDSTALIDATRNGDFLELLNSYSSNGCSLVTIPPVIYEFNRGARDIRQKEKFDRIVSDLGIEVMRGIDEQALDSKYADFILRLQNSAPKASYTDSLLCFFLYSYRHANVRLLTQNYRDIPLDFFEREYIITYEQKTEIRTHAIYKNRSSR